MLDYKLFSLSHRLIIKNNGEEIFDDLFGISLFIVVPAETPLSRFSPVAFSRVPALARHWRSFQFQFCKLLVIIWNSKSSKLLPEWRQRSWRRLNARCRRSRGRRCCSCRGRCLFGTHEWLVVQEIAFRAFTVDESVVNIETAPVVVATSALLFFFLFANLVISLFVFRQASRLVLFKACFKYS